ncbi:MAG: histidine--tRNA ligase [Candidatus Methanospirareceae archaeon]
MRIERVRGTRDFLPEEMRKRRMIEEEMRRIAERWGYEEVKTPTFEHVELFTLKSGEEIIKEMYDFVDKGGRHLALRPELTAPVIRMYVNEMKMEAKPKKFYYFGNCFRYEEPQRARYREFWQFGAEIIGSDKPEAQAEIIALSYYILKALHVKGDLRVGHVGLIREVLGGLSEEDKNRVMRMIDKGEREKAVEYMKRTGAREEIIAKLMQIIDIKGEEALDEVREMDIAENTVKELEETLEILDYYDVSYTLDFSVVRGLDYYTGMVFEIYAGEEMGKRSQICGGGSYRLAALFGGEDIPSTGFAFGFDRLVAVCDVKEDKRMRVVVVPVNRDAKIMKEAIRITCKLREHFPTYIDVMGRSLAAQLSYANSINASFAVIIGEKEIKEGKITLRNFDTGEQEKMGVEECIEKIRGITFRE